MKKIVIMFILLMATFLAALAAALPTSAVSTNDFYFEDATFDYYLSKDEQGVSRMRVVEQLTAIFPSTNQNHGIVRVIPYTNQGGKNQTMKNINNLEIKVTRNGQPEKVAKIERDNDYDAFTVYIGEESQYVHGEQIYVLEYEFDNVINSHDELYWDTNGTGWSQKFEKLTANLHLANDIQVDRPEDISCYVGGQGDNNQGRCTITKTADGFSFTAMNLRPRENLTFAVLFAPDVFTDEIRPVSRDYSMVILYAVGVTAICLMVIINTIVYYNKMAKPKIKYYKNLPTPVQYVPLRGLTVAELATTSFGATKDLVVATVLELAVAHKIELTQADKKDYSIRVRDLDGLAESQLTVLKALAAATNTTVEVGAMIPIVKKVKRRSAVTALVATFGEELEHSLTDKAIFIEKKKGGVLFGGMTMLGISWVLLVIVLTVGMVIIAKHAPSYILILSSVGPLLILIIISFIIVYFKSYAERTEKGLDIANYAAGLKKYIKLAEKDRLEFLQSVEGADVTPAGIVKLYERLLPYAAVFGLEKTWLKQLQFYYDEDPALVPTWYVGAAAFDSSDFATAMSSLSDSMSSMTSSSSDSGSGGGGFSGGGGGGGGGGGW